MHPVPRPIISARNLQRRYLMGGETIHALRSIDIEIQANEILRLKKRLNEILAENTGQPIEKIEQDTNRDVYMTAPDAVTYGLVDHVLEPPTA